MIQETADTSGNIALTQQNSISLSSGYYLIFYKVSCIFTNANYMQITPYYNQSAHIENGIYFATTTNGSSACGSAGFIINAATPTELSLTYSGTAPARDGELNITVLKLNR